MRPRSPVVYLEAEIFDEDGSQAVVAWRDRNVCVEPVSTELRMQDRSDSAQRAFNRVLRGPSLTRSLYHQRHTRDCAKVAGSCPQIAQFGAH